MKTTTKDTFIFLVNLVTKNWEIIELNELL